MKLRHLITYFISAIALALPIFGHAQNLGKGNEALSPGSYSRCFTDSIVETLKKPDTPSGWLYLGNLSKQPKNRGKVIHLVGISQACGTLVSKTCKKAKATAKCLEDFEGQLKDELDTCSSNVGSKSKASVCEVEIARLNKYSEDLKNQGALACFRNTDACTDDISVFQGQRNKKARGKASPLNNLNKAENSSQENASAEATHQAPVSILALTKTIKTQALTLSQTVAQTKGNSNSNYANLVKVKNNVILNRKPKFFGANYLLWLYEFGDIKGKGHILNASLKKLGIKKLRYPGGNFSQNIDLMTNKITVREIEPSDKKAIDPKNKNESTAKTYPSIDDFCGTLKQINAEGIIVINIESAFVIRKNDIAYNTRDFDGALKQSVKNLKALAKHIKDLNCPISQWELGNESNHADYIYPYSAEEYAESAIRHTKGLRSVFKNVRVGINNGKPDMIAFRDRLNAKGTAEFFKMSIEERRTHLEEFPGAKIKDAAFKLNGKVHVKNPKMWWPTVINTMNKKMKNSFDYIVVHSYIKDVDHPRFSDSLIEKGDFFSKLAGRKMMLSISEFGVYPKIKFDDSYGDTDFAIDHATMLSEMLRSPVQDVQSFDLRFIKKSYIDFFTQKLTPAGEAFRLFSNGVKTQILEDEHNIEDLDIVSSMDSKKLSVLMVNRSNKEMDTVLSFQHAIKSRIEKSDSLVAKSGGNNFREVDAGNKISRIPKSNDFKVSLAPKSITRYYFSIE